MEAASGIRGRQRGDQAKVVAAEAGAEAKDVLADVRQQLRAQANEQSDKIAALMGDIGTQLRPWPPRATRA